MSTKKKATKKSAKATSKVIPGLGGPIATVALKALRANKGADGALAAVKKEFPKAKTGISSIYWYASKAGIQLQKPAAAKAA